MLQFVILRHELPADHPRCSHWDLMLQEGSGLRTWALPDCPRLHQRQIAVALPDHRLEYLDREGPLSDGRGTITRWDRGELEWIVHDRNRLVARLRGGQIRAQVELTRHPTTQRWFFEASLLESVGLG